MNKLLITAAAVLALSGSAFAGATYWRKTMARTSNVSLRSASIRPVATARTAEIIHLRRTAGVISMTA